MADEKNKGAEKSSGGDPFVEIVWTILAILLLVSALSSVSAFLSQSNFFSNGWRSFTPSGLLSSVTKPISSLLNPIGSKFVVTSKEADLYDSPGGRKIDTKKLGDEGRIVGGPVTVNGEKYWQVRFEDGSTGWINEKDIGAISEKITPMNEMPTLIGTAVETNKEVAVYSSPGGDEIARVSSGQRGTILEGPIIKDGKKYWHIRFDDGTEGWVEEDGLDSLYGDREPLSEKPSLIGGTVEANKNGTLVYDSPGGNVIATKNKGSSGTILEGPLVIGGVKYWHIRFDDGTEGWVSENDLDYVEKSRAGFVIGLIKFIDSLFSWTKFLLILSSVVFVVFITYLIRNINKLAEEQIKLLYLEPNSTKLEVDYPSNPKWEKILSHSISQNESDWRLAIIEADIMLSELLDKMSLSGETIGDKLKNVEKSDFLTLDNAWEAHKVRNQIAHEGMSHKLTQKEVNRVIELYRSVFEEFKII